MSSVGLLLFFAACAVCASAQQKNIGDRMYKSYFPQKDLPFRILHTGGSIGSFGTILLSLPNCMNKTSRFAVFSDANKYSNTSGILLPVFSVNDLR